MRKYRLVTSLLLMLAAIGALITSPVGEARDPARIIAPTEDFSKPEKYERNQGGAGTSKKPINGNAFSHPAANIGFEQRADFFVGNGFFKRLWVTAPSSTQSADGLGPLYNARACQRCHLKDGRGHPPSGPDDSAVSMFLRLSVPSGTEEQRQARKERRAKVIPEPTYGGQLQDLAIAGFKAEGRMTIAYEEKPVELAGGEVVTLRAPTYGIEDLGYGPLHPGTMLSPRVAPAMIGLGLLEAIAEDDILAYADPEDADGDGVSGRPNRVWSLEHGRVMLGRFGWKAGNPTLNQQNSEAMAGDIGIANPLIPDPHGDCTRAQPSCVDQVSGADDDGLEAPSAVMDKILFYSRNLAVPARRDLDDPTVLQGKEKFYESGCIACHRPKYITPRDGVGEAQAYQLIWPYTDMLLHDMGEGLADRRPEGDADGYEWRTPPLWGIGLTETVNGHTYFLHDGRARNLKEAILWHGGEAASAQQRFRDLARPDREALIAFLNSL
ncbi:MAG: di-heme oxidoredictase family protein [Alphaproteobacteria bacterium]